MLNVNDGLAHFGLVTEIWVSVASIHNISYNNDKNNDNDGISMWLPKGQASILVNIISIWNYPKKITKSIRGYPCKETN